MIRDASHLLAVKATFDGQRIVLPDNLRDMKPGNVIVIFQDTADDQGHALWLAAQEASFFKACANACFRHTSDSGRCSIRCSRKMASFWPPVKWRREIGIGHCSIWHHHRNNAAGLILQFRRKQYRIMKCSWLAARSESSAPVHLATNSAGVMGNWPFQPYAARILKYRQIRRKPCAKHAKG